MKTADLIDYKKLVFEYRDKVTGKTYVDVFDVAKMIELIFKDYVFPVEEMKNYYFEKGEEMKETIAQFKSDSREPDEERKRFMREQAITIFELTKGLTPEQRAVASNEFNSMEEMAGYVMELTAQ